MAAFGTILKRGIAGPIGQVAAKVTPGLGYNLSKVLADTGQKYNLPDLKISEAFGSYQPPKSYVADNSQGVALGATTDTGSYNVPQPNADVANGPTKGFGDILKTTSGGQSGGGGGPLNLTAPAITVPTGGDTNQLRESYALARRGIEGQGQGLDQSYNLSRGDIENAVAESERAATEQKGALENQFGSILRNQLKTFQDTNKQRQGIFSNLGTLESSAYGDAQQRADTDFTAQRTQTDTEKVKALKSVDDELSSYRRQATSELSKLALQYQQGKQAIAQALSQNSLEEAGAIQSQIEQIKQRANDVQNTLINFGNQVALLKQQGADVRSKIGGVNADEYGATVNTRLQDQVKQLSSLAPQQNQFSFTGFIGPDGKRYGSREEYLRMNGVA